MQVGTYETHSRQDPQLHTAQGSFPSGSRATATGGNVEVELEATALQVATETAASNQPEGHRATDELGSIARKTNGEATNLVVSPEALRLALIPAQVMDAEEIAEARKTVAAGQEALADVRAENTEQAREADGREMEMRAEQPISPSLASDPIDKLDTPTASVPGKPDKAAAFADSGALLSLGGRSPFESGTPGATGQSIDIVVGEEPPPRPELSRTALLGSS